jgi:hypothetical protein
MKKGRRLLSEEEQIRFLKIKLNERVTIESIVSGEEDDIYAKRLRAAIELLKSVKEVYLK